MDIAIVDDLAQDRALILDLVLRVLEDRQLRAKVHSFSSGEEFFSAYRPGRFSIVLLDLYIEGLDGMSIAQRIRAEGDECQLVFITSSDTAAVSSYAVEAADYLLKPPDAASLERALSRCLKRLAATPKYIEIMVDRSVTRIFLNSILWINTHQNTLLFHTDSGVYKTYMTFIRLSRMLEGEPCFLMCYKGCLVNMDRVAAVEKNDFRMDNGDLVQIRKRGAPQVKHAYVQYLCSKAAE